MSYLKNQIFAISLALLLSLSIFAIFGLIGGSVNYIINDKLDKDDPKKTSNSKAFWVGFKYTLIVLLVGPTLFYILKTTGNV